MGGKFTQIGLHGIEQRFSVVRREAAVFLSVWYNTCRKLRRDVARYVSTTD